MALAGHPPHRSGRAELPHPAPALGMTSSRRLRMKMGSSSSTLRMHSAPVEVPSPGSVSSGTGALAHFPWLAAFPPSPPPLVGCSGTSLVLCRHPTARHRSSAVCVLGLSAAAQAPPSLSAWAAAGSPDSRSECFRACLGSQTPQSLLRARTNALAVWPSRVFDLVGTLQSIRISGLNTQPARSPVNASPGGLLPSCA
jgi:hypothetical protein